MATLDIAGDAHAAFSALQGGGIAIFPVDVGYTIAGGSAAALQRIFQTKRRAPTKLNAMVANMAIHRNLHVLPPQRRSMVETIVQDYDLPLGCIAPFQPTHPLMRNLDPGAVDGSTKDGTIAMLLNAGPFHAELCRLSERHDVPIFGSSCNFTNTGTKFRVEDIPDEMLALADVVIDYGLRKYHYYQRSATLINFDTLQVVRVGSCYDLISDVLARHFDVHLPQAA